MNFEVFITCAVTGAGDTTSKSDKEPVTPKEIAEAAIAHCHVREPETGKWSRDPELYKEVVDRIRSAGTDVVINLTVGMGGDVVFGPGESPLSLDQAGTDMVGLILISPLWPQCSRCTLWKRCWFVGCNNMSRLS